MIEKNKEAQSQSLGELQQELKSLKALLLSRGPATPPAPSIPSFSVKPSIPAWQLAGSDSRSSTPPVPAFSPTPNSKGKEVDSDGGFVS
jgi:peroxin-14